MVLHVFPILIPPPTSLSARSLWVFPVHQVWAQPMFLIELFINLLLNNKVIFYIRVINLLLCVLPKMYCWTFKIYLCHIYDWLVLSFTFTKYSLVVFSFFILFYFFSLSLPLCLSLQANSLRIFSILPFMFLL